MPLSDNYNYNIGDRVKSGITQEEGRVVDIKKLVTGAFMITVAIFVGGVAVSSKSFLSKVGQLSGLEWSIIGKAATADASKLGMITSPLEGGNVSAAAQDLALAGQPLSRSSSRSIADRLKAWNPKLANPTDEVAYADAVFDRLQSLRRMRSAVFEKGKQLDTMMNYLTATGQKGANGQWYGSYLTELIHNPHSAAADTIQRGDSIRKVLQKTGIPADLALRYKEFIPEGVETAWELLVHAKEKIKGLSYTEGNPLWNDYASIIKRAVEMSPGRKRLQARIDALNEAVDFTGDHLSHVQSSAWNPGKDPSRWGVFGGVTEPEADARSYHQFLTKDSRGKAGGSAFPIGVRARKFDRENIGVVKRTTISISRKGSANDSPFFRPLTPSSVTKNRFSDPFGRTTEPITIDVVKTVKRTVKTVTVGGVEKVVNVPGISKGRGIDVFNIKRQEQSPSVPDILTTGSSIRDRDIGSSTSLPKKLGRKKVSGPQAEDIFNNVGGMYEGKIVQYNGVPVRITKIDQITKRATLTPLSTNVDLLATDISARPGAAINALQKVSRTGATLPLEVDAVAQRAGQEAANLSRQMANGQAIAVRGGLLGGSDKTMQVPLDLLHEYMVGASTFKDAKALTQAGFRDISDFAKKSGIYSKRFRGELSKRLRAHPSFGRLTGTAFEQHFEDLFQGSQLAIFEHLGSIQGSRSISQLEQELLEVGVRGAHRAAFGNSKSVIAESFTELDREVNGAFQSGADLVERAVGRRQVSSVGRIASKTGGFLPGDNLVLADEFYAKMGLFSKKLRRAGGFKASPTNRMRLFKSTVGEFLTTRPDTAAALMDKVDLLSDRALRLQDAIDAHGRGHILSQGHVDLLEEGLGVKIVGGNAATRKSFQTYRTIRNKLGVNDPITKQAHQEYAETSMSYFDEVRERYFRREHLKGTGLERIGATELGATKPFGQPITTANEKQMVDILNPILSMDTTKNATALRELGISSTLEGNRVTPVLKSKSGESFLVKPTPGGLAAVSATNPTLARFLGDANQPFEVGYEDVHNAIQAGKFRVQDRTAEQVSASLEKAAAKASKAAFLEGYVGAPTSTLPVFRTGNTVAGFLGSDLVNAQSVIQNAKEAMAGKRALLFLDIETNREVNQITNFAMRRLEKLDGVWQEVGEAVHLATPKLWEMGGVGGSAASRIATRGGTTSLVGEILANEQSLVERAAQLIDQHGDATIIGHNIGFDITKLAEAQDINQSAVDIFRSVAKNRVTDTVLLSQITHPEQSEFSLAALGRNIAGNKTKQAHLALSDVQRNIEVFKAIASRTDTALNGLSALEQVSLNPDSVVWNEKAGRAFKVTGVLDAEAAKEAFFKLHNEELNVGFGVALQPIDFRTGQAAGPTNLSFARTPGGWAREFAGSSEVLSSADAAVRMEAKAADLASKRVRNITANDYSFTNLLAERERIGLANAATPEAFAAAQDDLLSRLAGATNPMDREILRGAHKYSQTYLQDSRIARQLELQRGFMGEVETAHKPVVDWLSGVLRTAPEGSLQSAKESVNAVWNEYMAKVNEAHPFPQMDVIPKSSLSLRIPELGKHQVALRTTDEVALRSSLRGQIFDIAQRIKNTDEFNNLFIDATAEEAKNAAALLKNKGRFLDAELGPTIEQHIFSKYLAPALQQGVVNVDGVKSDLSIQATTLNEAVANILTKTGEAARQNKTAANDYLAGRYLPEGALHSIQESIGVGGDVVAAAEKLSSPENLRAGFHHRLPNSWTGKRFTDLFENAINADAAQQMDFTDRMRSLFKRMGGGDQEVISQIAKQKTPQWLEEITGIKRAAEAVEAANPVRDFNPGMATKIGQEIGELAENNAQSVKAMGLLGLGIIAAGVALAARKPQTSPNKSKEEDDRENILHSTENEVSKRKERVANQVPMVNRITVNISGDDPTGVSHEELSQSVHSALGTFLGREINRASNIRDNRSRIDRDYLDRIAGQLISRPTPVR